LKCMMAGVVALFLVPSIFALDPNRTLSQYLRRSWGNEKGLPDSVSGIAQTADGYLWIGTDKGLLRFDGLNFRRFEQAAPSAFPIGPVRKLLSDENGNLWILLGTTKLLRYHDGRFDLSKGEAESGITAAARGAAGTVLFSSVALGTLTYSADRFVTVSPALVLGGSAGLRGNDVPDDRSTRLSWSTGLTPHRFAAPNAAVTSIAQSSDSKIWLGTEDGGLFYLNQGKIYAVEGLASARINCLLPTGSSQLWIGTSRGVMRWDGAGLTQNAVPPSLRNIEVLSMLRDRDSNVWVGTSKGLLRFNANGVSSLAGNGRATGAAVSVVFEDREGNIWAGGSRGLQRLRDSAFVTYALSGQESQSVGPVYADPKDHIWFAPIDGGLRRLNAGHTESLKIGGMTQDIVYSIAGRGNDLWLGRQKGGLTRLRYDRGAFSSKTYTKADGLAQNSVYAVYESRDATLWAGTLSGGLSEFRNGRFTTYNTANGLPSDTVSSIAESADGTMWFGTPNGLAAMSKSGWRTYAAREGLSSPDVNCLLPDSDGVLWVGTGAGLALFADDHIQVPQNVPDSLHGPVFGVAEDKNGWLWIATASHLLQVNRSRLMRDALSDTDVREFGVENGLQGTQGVKRFRSVITDSQGQVWISTNRGLSVVNTTRATVNPVPALVHVEAILADGTPIDLTGHPQIPPAKRRITFRYAGLSLSNPERVRYRYKLEGFDHGWSEPATNLEATYGNLSPGSYQFRVMASNGDGQWDGSGGVVGFNVEPALWQTWWFRLGCVLTAGLSALLVYRLRMRRLTELLNIRFEERLAERTRIAHEIHDTLLQGFLSASMQLHILTDQLPEDAPQRKPLDHILNLMGRVIDEARNAVRGLRPSSATSYDLEEIFSRLPEELAPSHQADFRVVVEGLPRTLRPVIRDEVYRIGREALTNVFRHSRANTVNVELKYGDHELQLVIRDDGRGIDLHVLESGREGHFGLSGMRDRAENIGASLKVWSSPDAGTEVGLSVPGRIAFESEMQGSLSKWFSRMRFLKNDSARIGTRKMDGSDERSRQNSSLKR
jgi:ligand-binding sensor domain-containing protein/signal transduction histidine kinase